MFYKSDMDKLCACLRSLLFHCVFSDHTCDKFRVNYVMILGEIHKTLVWVIGTKLGFWSIDNRKKKGGRAKTNHLYISSKNEFKFTFFFK